MKTVFGKSILLAFFLFSFILIASLSSFSTEYSANAVLTGDCGEGSNVYWEIVPNDDVIEGSFCYSMNIFGTGTTFKNLNKDGNPVGLSTYNETKWEKYRELITRVYIGDNITTLSSSSFVRNSSIKTVELGANVTVLGSAAFESCKSLTTVYRKGNDMVEGTFDLTGIRSFGGYLFDGCCYVENIILPTEGSYTLPIEFLKNNSVLKSIQIPAACKSIECLAFRNCSALETIYIEGNTALAEGDITKGNEGTFYAYAIHASGKDGNVSISAIENSPAHEYALKNATYTVGEDDYTIGYIPACEISIYEGNSKIATSYAVKGFTHKNELLIDKKLYVLFSDAEGTILHNNTEKINNDINLYAKELLNVVGYMVRIKDYHGLRAIYEYNTTVFDNVKGYSVTEVGTLGDVYYGIEPVLDLDTSSAEKITIYSGSKLVGKLTKYQVNGISTFSSVATGFDKDGELNITRIGSKIMFRAFVTITNDDTGEEYTFYSPLGLKDLTSVCEATVEKGTDILSADALTFLSELVDIGIDTEYLYTKEEALTHLTNVYNDGSHILSGQHISYSKTIVRDTLRDIYEATGEYPAVLSFDTSTAYRSAFYSEENNRFIADDFAEFARQGGLISMCAHLANPDPDVDPSTLTNGVYRGTLDTLEKWDLLFEEGTAINKNLMTELSAAADILQLLEDRGVTVFWRPLHEMNGAWFWFCGASVPTAGTENDVSAEYCRKLWIYIYDYLVTERGLDNLIWVYSPNIAADDSNASAYDVMKYYPGNEYVDVVGIDWYNNSDTLAGDTPTLLTDSYANVWSKLASTGHPVVYGEFGPGDNLRNADITLSYSGEDALDLVTKVAASGRKMGYIVFWNGWQDNWISLQMMPKADKFMQSEIILDLGEARDLIFALHYGK